MPKQALKEKYKRYLTGIIVYNHFPVPVTFQLLNTNNLKFSVNNRPVTIPYQFVITAATLTQTCRENPVLTLQFCKVHRSHLSTVPLKNLKT